MKIAVLTFECPPANFRKLSFPNKRKYCEKHGYSFLGYTDRLSNRSWDKIGYILKHLNEYDWIFWSDADSFIVNSDIKLEEFISPEKDLIIQLDKSGKTYPPLGKPRAGRVARPSGIEGVNAGQMFIKNSKWSKWFLEECWQNEKYNYVLSGPNWEQKIIKKIIGQKGEKLPEHVKVYKDFKSGFNVVPELATVKTFMVHFRSGHREGHEYILDYIF